MSDLLHCISSFSCNHVVHLHPPILPHDRTATLNLADSLHMTLLFLCSSSFPTPSFPSSRANTTRPTEARGPSKQSSEHRAYHSSTLSVPGLAIAPTHSASALVVPLQKDPVIIERLDTPLRNAKVPQSSAVWTLLALVERVPPTRDLRLLSSRLPYVASRLGSPLVHFKNDHKPDLPCRPTF
jgi:hypothetical protein